MREYKSGTRWCLWHWKHVEDYMSRLHIIQTPLFSICLHHIKREDREPYEHDHPVSFLSFILRGSYMEERDGITEIHYWFNYIRATDHHAIVKVKPKTGCWTLCFMGPRQQEWGFFLPEGKVLWKDYYSGR